MNVVVTKTALKHFQKIVDYLVDEWGETVGIQFKRKINRFRVLALSTYPVDGYNGTRKSNPFDSGNF
jgi:plasmid stabilization system protein ParE